jgi:COMPASS component SWD2
MQIYSVKEGRWQRASASKKYGVKLARFSQSSSAVIYASTKVDREWAAGGGPG